MDIFKIEDYAHYANLMCGNMENMGVAIKALGGVLVSESSEKAALLEVLSEVLDNETIDKVLALKNQKIKEYFGRYSTDEMKAKIAKAGFAGTVVEEQAVVVDADFAEDAIDYGFDVFALKDGEQLLLEYHNKSAEMESAGYILTVSPFTYEAMLKVINDDEEYLEKYNSDDDEYHKEHLWSIFR